MIAPITERRISAGSPSLRGNEVLYVNTVLAAGWLTMGYYVKEFEAAFAAYIGVKHAITVSSGTAALHLALLAAGIGAGDEVIIPATTFIATANAVTYCGAKAVIVDVDPDTWCIDPDAIIRASTPRTKAIIPVGVYGNPPNMDLLIALAASFGWLIIEDAAETLGGKYGDAMIGSMGHAGCYSLYGNKTITCGEGGVVVTNDDHIAQQVHLLRGQGQTPGARYWHEVVGFNYRLTDLQAAVALAQLEQIDSILMRRRAIFEAYLDACPKEWQHQVTTKHAVHGCWAFALTIPNTNTCPIMAELAHRGIETRPIFPPLHLQDPYWNAEPRPASERLYDTGIVLPTHAELTVEDAYFVMDTLKEVAKC